MHGPQDLVNFRGLALEPDHDSNPDRPEMRLLRELTDVGLDGEPAPGVVPHVIDAVRQLLPDQT